MNTSGIAIEGSNYAVILGQDPHFIKVSAA
jgi:hypothetical protein